LSLIELAEIKAQTMQLEQEVDEILMEKLLLCLS